MDMKSKITNALKGITTGKVYSMQHETRHFKLPWRGTVATSGWDDAGSETVYHFRNDRGEHEELHASYVNNNFEETIR